MSPRAAFLQRRLRMTDGRLELVADRFLVTRGPCALDLASGDEVVLRISGPCGAVEQARWARRCDWFLGLHHRLIARLVDYGVTAEGRRFEAWRCGCAWTGRRAAAARAEQGAARFLRACGFDGDSRSALAVHGHQGVAVVVPGLAADLQDSDAGWPGLEVAVRDRGLRLVQRQSVAAVAEIIAEGGVQTPRVVALWGPQGSGLTTAIGELARVARQHGYVPTDTRLVSGSLRDAGRGRSRLLIARCDVERGWQRLLSEATCFPRPHVMLFAGRDEVARVPGVGLEPLAAGTMVAAIVPPVKAGETGVRIERIARRANGRPGQFARLLWCDRAPEATSRSGRGPLAAEAPARYGDVASVAGPKLEPAAAASPADVDAYRRRLEIAAAQVARGRHAPGERALRAVVGSLQRRGDWRHAAQGALLLASTLIARGRPEEARRAVARARETLDQGDAGVACEAAILVGVAATDLGRLDEAERTLTAAVAEARSSRDVPRLACGTLALGRCLFWSGRYGDAEAAVAGLETQGLPGPASIRRLALGARIAVGLGDLGTALARSTSALQAADALGEPAMVAEASSAAAFVHLAAGDRASVERDVAICLHAAHASRDPLRALRARLVRAEGARRSGQPAPPRRMVDRASRFSQLRLPPILRARVDMLRELLDGEASHEVAARHAASSGLAALRLFAPAPPTPAGLERAADDATAILLCCQASEDDLAVLARLCACVRARLRAVAVGFFASAGTTIVPVVVDGPGLDVQVAARVMTNAQPIAPSQRHARIEGGAPVRYTSETIGALVARWSLTASPDAARASFVMTMAAIAGAPALAGLRERRSRGPNGAGGLLGTSREIADVRRAIERSAASPFAVLIEGESGSGKELVARELHRCSQRRDRPFRTLNCAALPDELVEAELFGHSKGAFTGAVVDRPGVFEDAHTGTLFLDEVGELSPRAQAKVLRTIQEGELRRIGENVSRHVDVRIVAATNRDLRHEVASGRFRLDLLYRLDVIRITVPPLRDRRDDVAELAERFWSDAAARIGSRARLATATVAALAQHDWPGNVRELQNVLAALAVRSPRRGLVPPTALPPVFGPPVDGQSRCLDAARRAFEEQFVRAALVRSGGCRTRAAAELGMTRQGLTKLLARLALAPQRAAVR